MPDITESSGATSSGITLSYGDNLYDLGTISGTGVSDDGNQYVYSGGTASATTVNSGGLWELTPLGVEDSGN